MTNNSLFDTTTALVGKSLAFEGLGVKPMTKSSRVLFHDTFEDGLFHGWRPVHVGGDVPWNPLSVETEFPAPGLFLATGSTPYRANATANSGTTFKGLSGRFPTTGIVSFAGKFYIQSGGPGAGAAAYWSVMMDIQNWTDTLRVMPAWQLDIASGGGPARWTIRKNDGSFTPVGAAGSVQNPADPALSGTNATVRLTGGENEAKWDENYLRVSYDLGDLFSRNSGATTARYYEMNINGYRFDLRADGVESGTTTPQAGTSLSSFRGGLNFGINVFRSTAAGTVYPARMIAGDLTAVWHDEGWLA